MKKALLLSIKPRFADAIFTGDKKFELRRVKPKLQTGDLVLVYVTSPRCSLEGAFTVKAIIALHPEKLWPKVRMACSLTKAEYMRYFEGKDVAYAISIAEAWPLETTRNLAELRTEAIIPPQSYRYLSPETTASLLGDAY